MLSFSKIFLGLLVSLFVIQTCVALSTFSAQSNSWFILVDDQGNDILKCAGYSANYSTTPKWEGSRFVYARNLKQNPNYECLYDLKVGPDQLVHLATSDVDANIFAELCSRTDMRAIELKRGMISRFKIQGNIRVHRT